MTVQQTDVIDHVLRDSPEPGTWTLVAVEHRRLLDTQERVDQVIAKFRTYRQYLLSGQFHVQFPDANGARIRLALVYYDGEVGTLLSDSLAGIAVYLRDREGIDMIVIRTERPPGTPASDEPDDAGWLRLAASSPDEAEYFAARTDDDLTRSLLALFRITLQLPVRGGRGKFLLAERSSEHYIVAYTSQTTLRSVAGGSGADGVQSAPFIELLAMWEGIERGLIVNPGTAAELALPASTVPNILLLHETVTEAESAVAGFRFASVFDGADAAGRPIVSGERGWIADPAERERLAGYLAHGELIMIASGLGIDALEPRRGLRVPAGMRTDGLWVWSDATAYYLHTHGVAPDPALRERIIAHGYRCPEVTEEQAQAATMALKQLHDGGSGGR